MMISKAYFVGMLTVALGGAAMAQTPPAEPVAPRTTPYASVTNNVVADNSVLDYTKRPTLIQGKQYFAGSGGASLVDGYFAFNGMGLGWFGSVTTTATNSAAGAGEFRVGATTSAFGGGLIFNFQKSTTSNAAGDGKLVVAGDGYGAFGDFALPFGDIYAEAASYTGPGNYTNFEPSAGADATNEPYTLHFMLGFKHDASTEGTHGFNVEDTYNMTSISATGATDVKTMSNVLYLGHGYILKANSSYSVFLGSNNFLIYTSSDAANEPAQYGILLGPTISFQKQLGKGFEGFAGGSGALEWNMASDQALTPPAPALPLGTPTDASTLRTSGAFVDIGLRWSHENFAVEGSLSEALLQSGPNFISGATNAMFGQVGISLGI